MFQIISDFYLPFSQSGMDVLSKSQLEEDSATINTSDSRAFAMLRKIELSKGYENYRKQRLIIGVAKPPVLLSRDPNCLLSKNDHSPTRINNTLAGLSSFKTISMVGGGASPYRSVSIFHTASRMGIPVYNESDSHLIELTEAQEKILNILFEHFSHIDDATKNRVIKASYIVDIFAGLGLPHPIDRKDVDISAKRIK
jgi:hypothetical protein